jgi:hypothetical protein
MGWEYVHIRWQVKKESEKMGRKGRKEKIKNKPGVTQIEY